MKEISHQQAQTYLQTATDESLRADEKALLDAHLLGCGVCRAYANEIARLESALRTTMQHRWDVPSLPLRLDQILNWQKTTSLRRVPSMLAAPILVVLLVLFAVTLTRGQLTSRVNAATASATVVVTTVPTPSAQLTHINTAIAKCTNVIYTIQDGDTLESISAAYSISKEEITEYNNLESEQLTPFAYLILPICDHQTTSTPSTTLTYTPSISANSLTP